MIIRKEGEKPLISAGIVRIAAHDQWSVTLKVQGLEQQTGNPLVYDVVLSWAEVDMLIGVARAQARRK